MVRTKAPPSRQLTVNQEINHTSNKKTFGGSYSINQCLLLPHQVDVAMPDLFATLNYFHLSAAQNNATISHKIASTLAKLLSV